MTDTRHEDLERSLRDLFDRQHHAVEPSDTGWDPAATVAVVDLDSQRSGPRRRLGVAAIAVTTAAATIAIGLGVVSLTGTDSSPGKAHPPVGSPGPGNSTLPPGTCLDGTTPATFPCSPSVRWDTPRVHLEGSQFSIVTLDKTGAKGFIANDPKISVYSNPGDATYQTLELEWHENGVEQRWFIYFATDGKEWWATQMRTLDGSKPGDWVGFDGQRFRTPIGSAWRGDLDVTASNHGVTSHLRMHITHLQAFLIGAPTPEGTTTTTSG